ncbi:MAG: hypothetical protein J6T99_07080, partial [Oscillospiraceae bacterium]|nr:hypothetical protein [Oscillospiraceae bacterium]
MANPTIKIAVSQADATLVQTTTLTAGMRVTPTVKFSFADEWSGLGKTAVCRAGAVCLEVLIVNNQITVPIECLETAGVNLIIGVYGTDTTIAIPTVWCACGEILSGTNVEEPSNVGEATPTLVDQMLAYAADIEALAEDIDENVIRNVAVNTEGANAYGITTVTLADTGAGENRTLTFYFSNLKGNGIESITWSSVPPYRGRIQITQSNGTVTNFDALIDAINFLESLTNLSEAYAKGTIGGVDVEEGEPGYQDNAKYYAEMAADAEDGAEAAQADAEEAQSYAEAAQDAAEAAQTAAETAQGLAEAAQTAAETAASNAILSSESAAADAVTAGNHAAAAEASSVQAGSYSDAASTSAGNSANSASSSAEQALKSEGYAVGAQNGTEVSSGSTYYHNNAKYYSEKAYDDAQATAADRAVVEGAMDAIEDARDDAISDI